MFVRFERGLSISTKITGAIILSMMVLLITIDVLMRNLAGAGFPATADIIARYMMVLVSFSPIAYAEVQRRHVEVQLVSSLLSPRLQHFVLIFSLIVALLIYSVFFYGSSLEAIDHTATRSFVEAGNFRLMTWPSYWVPPFSFGLMLCVVLIHLVRALQGESDLALPDVRDSTVTETNGDI